MIVTDILFLLFLLDKVVYTKAVNNKIPIRWEKEVVDDILTNYSTTYRPVKSNVEPLDVSFDLQLRQLVGLEIKRQVISATVFITMEWFDPQLSWDRKKFNGTIGVNIEPSQAWTPDIVLYNTADDEVKSSLDLYKTRLRVNSSGTVTWVSALMLEASCSVDIQWFPFDKQYCTLTFGSWSYPSSQLRIKFKSQPQDKSDIRKGGFLVNNGEWIFDSLVVDKRNQHYSCCPEDFSIISYTMHFTRRSGYWLLYLILPCLSLSCLFLLAFYIPHLSGERIAYGVTMILNMSVYLLVISDKLPEKSDQSPLLGILYVIFFYIMSVGLVALVFTNCLAFRKTDPPAWLKKRFLKSKQQTSRPIDTLGNVSNGDMVGLEAIPPSDSNSSNTKSSLRHRQQSLYRRQTSIASVSLNEREQINTEMWIEIAGSIDRLLSLVFALQLILFPSIVILAFYIGS